MDPNRDSCFLGFYFVLCLADWKTYRKYVWKYRNPQKILKYYLLWWLISFFHGPVLLSCIIMLLHLVKSRYLPCTQPYHNRQIFSNCIFFYSPTRYSKGKAHSVILAFHIVMSVSFCEMEKGQTSPTVYLEYPIISVIKPLMGTSWQETSGSSNNTLQGKHFALEDARSWEIHLKVPLSWSHLTVQQTVPVLRVLRAPRGVRTSFLHPCSSSLPGDFRSATQDLFPLFLLLLCNWVKTCTCTNFFFF